MLHAEGYNFLFDFHQSHVYLFVKSKQWEGKELNSYRMKLFKMILKMFFEKFLLTLAPSSPLSTNIHFLKLGKQIKALFYHWKVHRI